MNEELFLSRLLLARESRSVQLDLSDCHALHRRVMSGFDDLAATSNAREHYGVMHRLDASAHGGPELLVQSAVVPNWSQLPSDYLAAGRDNPGVKNVSAAYAAIEDGMRLRFKLRANASRKVDTKSIEGRRRNGRRVVLTKREDQLSWLTRKANGGGFRLVEACVEQQLVSADVRREAKIVGRSRSASWQLTFGSVLFEGVLEVVDVARFRETIRSGIGPGKAFGFGLLSVGRA